MKSSSCIAFTITCLFAMVEIRAQVKPLQRSSGIGQTYEGTEYTLRAKDGTKILLYQKDKEPLEHPRVFYGLDLFGGTFHRSDYGPLAIGPNINIWDKERQNSLFVQYIHGPMDAISNAGRSRKPYNFRSAEFGCGIRLSRTDKVSTKRQKITVGSRRPSLTRITYRYTGHWPSVIRYCARFGAFGFQGSLSDDIGYLAHNEGGLASDSIRIELDGIRTYGLFAGFSKQWQTRVNYSLPFTSQDLFSIKELYMDVLWGIYNPMFGRMYRYFGDNQRALMKKGNFSNEDLMESRLPFGCRIGFNWIHTIAHRKGGIIAGLEGAFLPGLQEYNILVSFKTGYVFRKPVQS